MLVSEFIKRKNEIIYKHTGLILVPKDQIEECAQFPLRVDANDGSACPYCRAFYHKEGMCCNCPMYKAGNYCDGENSSYRSIVMLGEDRLFSLVYPTQPFHEQLKDLINQYNEELILNSKES